MLLFIIPIKSKHAATSWLELCKLFERSLRAVFGQVSPEFQIFVVCNERPEIEFQHPQVQYLDVNFSVPAANYNARADDRVKQVFAGLLATRDLQPSHVMLVDADDSM